MDANVVTQEAGHRIRGAKLRDSFVASPVTHSACEDLQRQFEEVARPGETVPVVYAYVDFINRVAERRFAEYLAADREVRATRNLCAYLAQQRDGAATEVAAVLTPAKRASDELLPEKGLKLWLHGPVARTPESLHRQAEEVAFLGREARDDLSQPVLRGIRLDVDELVAEIERRNGKLGGVLGSQDEAAGHLEATLFRARKAGKACDQSYLQVKATLEAVCGLGGQSVEVRKYGPPSLRKLQRTKKRKKRVVVAEQVAEAAVKEHDVLAATPVLGVEESDLQDGTRAASAEESDLQDGTRSAAVQESDLQNGTRSAAVQESDLQTGTCPASAEESDLQDGTRSTAVCRDSSALPDSSRRKRRRDLAVTSGGGGHGGRFSAVTGGVRGPRRGRLSVTKGVCGPRGSGSEVTDTVRSPENRGGAVQVGVTARIRRFFSLPFG